MLQFRNSKIFCLLFMLIVFHSMKGMLSSSSESSRGEWKNITEVEGYLPFNIAQLSLSGNHAFIGGSFHLSLLLALRLGHEARKYAHSVAGLKNVISAAFHPDDDKKRIAVVDEKGLNLVEFEDLGMGGITSKTRLILSNDTVNRGDGDQLQFVKYNDEGTALIIGSSFGEVLAYSTDSKGIIYHHNLMDHLYSLQSLPGQFFPGNQLLLGGDSSVYFCDPHNCKKLKIKGLDAYPVIACFDKKSEHLIERIDSDENSFLLSKIDPRNFSLKNQESYKDSEMKLTMNTSKGEVLLIEHADSDIITDIDFNPIGVFPKEHDIANAILSNDGHRLATIDSTGHIVRFWQKKYY